MSSQRILVMGDNHGNTQSLERVIADTQGERFDYIIHVGDFTNAHNDGKEAGVKRLRAVEPRLETLADRADNGFLYVYGNRDYYGDLDYELDVGTYIPKDDVVTVAGQRFTQGVEAVEADDILVTHGEEIGMIDHFQGRAYFCGHTHTGRYKDRMLNSAFLYRDDSKADTAIYGGYFVVEMTDDPPFDVDLRNLGRLDTTVCEAHQDRGVLIGPDYHSCMYCWQPNLLMREMARAAFYGVTHDTDREYATDDEVVEYAVDLRDSPSDEFREQFRDYISHAEGDPLGPLVHDDEGRLVDAYADL